jgi:uroporphyrinogen III methyltransferase/synthase
VSKGCIYLVGAGPGDPGLITVRGQQLLSQADVVVYDYLVAPKLLRSAPANAELIYVGKKAGQHTLSQDGINKLLVAKAKTGAKVVRLKGGDPFVFGRGGEEALEAVESGIDFEVVPGITAGVAGPAYAGIPVTHRTLASNVGLVTGHETPDKTDSDLDFEALARWRGTLVFYMGVGNLERICSALVEHGMDADTPVALVRWGTTTDQRVVTGTATTIAAIAREAQIKPPALIVVGKVVGLRDQLSWFERRPLFGQRIVVTRARAQASSFTTQLEQLGADVIEMPTIRITPPTDDGPLQEAIGRLSDYDWVVFTSANAVEMFFAALAAAGLDSRALHGVKLCIIGPVTAERLSGFGLKGDCQPANALGRDVVEAMAQSGDLTGKRVLCPRSDIAPPDLIDALTARGAKADDVAAYRTESDCADAEQVKQLLADDRLHWVTFTSSSTVKNFFDVIDPGTIAGGSVRLASIGPKTSEALEAIGRPADVEAHTHTIEGLTEALLEAVRGDVR